MRSTKDIIRRKYIELDDIKSVVSSEDFRKYVGVSINTFETKLGKIDNSLDQFAFKVQASLVNKPLSKWYVNSTTSDLGNFTILKSLCNQAQHNSSCREALIENTSPSDFYKSFQSQISIQEYELNFEGYAVITEQANDNQFIRTLTEKYGDDWEIIYEQLIGFKQVFSILLNIERLLFDEQNEQYHNSCSRLSQFEFFDLISTLKKMENYLQVQVVNYPYYSSVISTINEKKGYNCNSDFFK